MELGQFPYSFSVQSSRLHGSVLSLLASSGFEYILWEFANALRTLSTPESQHIIELSRFTGMDLISSAYSNHTYGHMLRDQRAMVRAVMRFSQVLEEPAELAKDLKALFLDRFAKALAGLGSQYVMVDPEARNPENFRQVISSTILGFSPSWEGDAFMHF